MMRRDSRSETTLRQLLDGVGLRYAVRVDSAGRPSASFRFAIEPDGEPVDFTAALREPILSITVHRVLHAEPGLEELRWVNQLNSRRMRGVIYYDRETGSYAISGSAYLGLGSHASGAVRDVVWSLRDAARWIRAGWWRDPRYGFHMEDFLGLQWLRPPPAGGDEVVAAVEHALVRAGLDNPSIEDSRLRIEVGQLFGRLLHVRAWSRSDLPLHPGADLLEQLQELNRQLTAGWFWLDEETGRGGWGLTLPIAWTTVDAPLAHWILHTASVSIAQLRRVLGGP
jgi:hypothetical protein